MRTRSAWLGAVAVLAFIASACAAAATPTPPPATAAPTAAPTEAPTAAPTVAYKSLKIGVVTDVGSVDDKNFNEYTYKGALDGAAAIGADEPAVVVPKAAADYAKLIGDFATQGFDTIVTVGFNLGAETTKAAKEYPDITFIGVDQSPICVDETGALDTTFGCKGDAKTLLPNYISLTYQEDQPGYLAGMVAAALSKNGVIGAIGGITLCGPCVRYIQGYELGAKSINPDIKVFVAYVTESDFVKAFYDKAGGKTFAKTFIALNKPDVIFQVAGQTGNGVLEAACEAGLLGVGVDVDQYLSIQPPPTCLVTSAEKHLQVTVADMITRLASGTATPGDNLYDATNEGIGVSPFHDFASQIPADLQGKLDEALAQMKAGTLKTCPSKADGDPVDCGRLQ
ncbi:MAG TPA: BMP family ABC transporter substrate-binding protein [Candidatus Limnocylindria bacterium]